ncbi:hypothetical protein CMI37_34160 [Candidatus Pacearchaeota archaeon]|nr:hypothetical protein [Candidatus Pacearchaeota archaeon]
MAAPTLTETLDNMYTTTWRNRKREIVDNIFDATPFWFWLRAHGGMESVVGGRSIDVELAYASSSNVGYISKGDTVSLADKEFLTLAQYEWRYLADSIVRFGVDEQQNAGKNKIFNLMQQKLTNSQDSLVDQLETSLFTAQSGKTINSMLDLVADVPTNTIGGLSGTTYSWWQNKVKDMTGLSFAVHGVKEMRTIINSISNNKGGAMPDIIVTHQTPYEYYEDDVVEQKRIVNKKLGDAGFENIQFKGTPIIWSPSCPSDAMYFMNTKYLKFTYDPRLFFDMTEWKAIPDQVNDRAAQIVVAGNLVTNRRRAHGVMFDIDTA